MRNTLLAHVKEDGNSFIEKVLNYLLFRLHLDRLFTSEKKKNPDSVETMRNCNNDNFQILG